MTSNGCKTTRTRTSAAEAAAVIVALGAEQASHVYKCLHEDEIEQLSLEVAKLQQIPQEKMHEIMEDFYNLGVNPKGHCRRWRDLCQRYSGKGLWPRNGGKVHIDRLSVMTFAHLVYLKSEL